MKKTAKYLALTLLCLNFWQTANAQQTTLQPFKIGDKLPESFWKQSYEIYTKGKTSTQTLEHYKGKLLILDFWATWCGNCIKKFSFADSLQRKYGDKAAIILINCKNVADKPERITKLMDQADKELITITGDTVLTKLFPHRVIPHYVWIESGQFRSATGGEFFNEQSILSSFDRRDEIDKITRMNQKQ
jgi:thiol-disulfide isomerase/thioredoxin